MAVFLFSFICKGSKPSNYVVMMGYIEWTKDIQPVQQNNVCIEQHTSIHWNMLCRSIYTMLLFAWLFK